MEEHIDYLYKCRRIRKHIALQYVHTSSAKSKVGGMMVPFPQRDPTGVVYG